MARCQATTKAGKPCRAPASAGGLCFLHANPSQVRELGRAGGRKNRQQLQEPPPASSMTPTEVSEALVGVAQGLQSKKISPRRASALVQVYSLLMKTLPAADMDARLSRLEEQMGMQVLAPAPEIGPAPAPVTGSAVPVDESVQPDGKLGVTLEEEVPERPRADSDVEQGASSNSVARTKGEAAITKLSEKQE